MGQNGSNCASISQEDSNEVQLVPDDYVRSSLAIVRLQVVWQSVNQHDLKRAVVLRAIKIIHSKEGVQSTLTARLELLNQPHQVLLCRLTICGRAKEELSEYSLNCYHSPCEVLRLQVPGLILEFIVVIDDTLLVWAEFDY